MNCEICGSSRPITHHINGNKKENQKGNLILLCPSCHSRLHEFQNGNPELTESLIEFKKKKAILEEKMGPCEVRENAMRVGYSKYSRISTELYLIIKNMSEENSISQTFASLLIARAIKKNIELFKDFKNCYP